MLHHPQYHDGGLKENIGERGREFYTYSAVRHHGHPQVMRRRLPRQAGTGASPPRQARRASTMALAPPTFVLFDPIHGTSCRADPEDYARFVISGHDIYGNLQALPRQEGQGRARESIHASGGR